MSAGAGARRSWLAEALGHRGFAAGAAITFSVAALALLSLVWTPYDPTAIAISAKFQPPSLAHWLGTDQYGRDTASMIMAGAASSLTVSVLAVAIGLGVGVPMGLIAGARGGAARAIVLRLSDFIFAFPALIIAIMLRELWGPGLLNATVAIGIFNIPVFARVTYGAALPLWRRDFVLAARVSGKTTPRIATEHILPNLFGVLIVQASVQLSLGILAEAGLSYVGLGVQPPWPSWGRMLNEAQTLMGIAPRLALVPGLAIVVTVLGLNLMGDGLRDLADPRWARGPAAP